MSKRFYTHYALLFLLIQYTEEVSRTLLQHDLYKASVYTLGFYNIFKSGQKNIKPTLPDDQKYFLQTCKSKTNMQICSLNLQRRSVTVTYMCTHVRMYCNICTYICTHCVLVQDLGRPAHSTYTSTQTLMYVHTYVCTYTHTHLDLKELEVLVRRGRWEYPHQLSTPPHLQ